MNFTKVEPLTEAELELLAWVTVSSAGVALIGFIICLASAIYVAVKIKIPLRFLVLTSAILLMSFLGYEQYMGGNLEWVFGPIGNLFKVIAYSLILVVFSVGYFRSAKFHGQSKNH